MGSVVGVCASRKPFPSIVLENAWRFAGARTVLDVGAGDGRFAKFFLSRFDLDEYVAVEPDGRLVARVRV